MRDYTTMVKSSKKSVSLVTSIEAIGVILHTISTCRLRFISKTQIGMRLSILVIRQSVGGKLLREAIYTYGYLLRIRR
jgi:hypothetical protein